MSSSPDPVDVHVGSRVRLRRALLGLSQSKLAQTLGLTFQQVQKYEKGYNRIGSSRLFQISQTLGVPVAYFFEDMPVNEGGAVAAPAEPSDADLSTKRETLELVRAYCRIGDPAVRKRIVDLVKAVGAGGEPGGAAF